MEELTRLVVHPSSSSVAVDTTPKECNSEGFNYPSFRLLNKQARVALSKNFLNGGLGFSYRLFAVANSKGWFAAVSNDSAFSLVFSPLSDLRSAIKNASGTDSVLAPQRILPLPSAEPCILAFTLDELRLIVGFKQGTVVIYETDKLFSSGSSEISPLHVLQSSSSPPLEILVNPSNEPGMTGHIAILRADGTVQILNPQLNPQGGWMADIFDSTPVAVDWSPKGKQIAIGLRRGDICTFTLDNKASPQKHFPPTCQGQLASLTWLSPGHTFRVAYLDPSTSSPTHQFVYFDSKSSKLCYTNLSCPFPVPDRPQPIAQIMTLPQWDEVPGTTDEHRSLLVVGDLNSVDLEVLGIIGNRWFQQSQENPLTIPLDKNLDDTFLLGLAVDLTDPESKRPIMYAYLNDGTVQAWYLDHPTPYPRIITPGSTATSTPLFASTQQSTSTGSSFGQPAPGQPSLFSSQSTQAFGQPSFGSAAPSGFGQAQQTATFGQSSFGQPATFGSNPSGSAFGSSSSSINASNAFSAFSGSGPTVFGQSSFGSFGTSTPAPAAATPQEMIREASMEDSTTFGSLSLGDDHSEPQPNKTNMFGTPPPLPLPPDHPSNKPSTPSSGSFSTFGSSGTSGFGSGSTSGNSFIKPASGFGVGAFNSNSPFTNPGTTQNQPSAFSAGSTSDSPKPTSHPAFGSSGFSSPSLTTSGGFGAFSNKSNAFNSTTSTAFASFSTGPSSFGSALQNNKSTTSAFSGSQTDNSPTPFGTATGGFAAFSGSGPSSFGTGSTDKPTPASGQTGFGEGSIFGQPSSGSTFGSGVVSGNSPFTPREPPVSPSKDVPAVRQDSTSSGLPPSPPSPSSSLPSPTPFKNSSSTGAFSNLKASPIGPGIGAFGASMSSDSPFLKATQNQNPPPVSAFSLSTTPTPSSSTTTATPTFGARSALGGPQKSTFGAPAPATSSTPTKSGGAFEAYSGSTFGFGSAAGKLKSFAELSADSRELTSAPKSAFSSVSESSERRAPVFTPPIKEEEKANEEEKAKEDEKPQETSAQSVNVAPKLSIESISSQSSFVEVSKDEDTEGKEEEEEEEAPVSDKDGDGEGENENETEEEDSDFLSEHITTEEEDDEETDDQADEPAEPTKVPLPPSRSPSSTPQPEESPYESSPSPSDGSSSGRLSTIREESTTPPGSPTRGPTPSKSPALTPTPTAGLGLGRPSTRPSRSSPLASTPPSVPEEEEKMAEKQSLKARPAPSRGVFGVLPEKSEADAGRSRTPPTSKSAPPSVAAKTEATSVDGLLKQSKSMFDAPLKAFKETLDDLNPQLQKLADEGKLMAPGALPPAKASASPSPILSFGQAATTTTAKQSPFGNSAASTPTFTPPKPSTFSWGLSLGTQSSTPVFSQSPSTPPLTAIGLKTPPAGGAAPVFPAGGLFGSSQPQLSGPVANTPILSSPAVASTELPVEEGMQKECAILLTSMNKELEGLRMAAQTTATRRQELTRKTVTGAKRKEDLGDATKWALRDSEQFGVIMKSLQNDLVEVGTIVSGHKEAIQDLRSSMLKTTTRKEEVARFHKAKKDNEFAKMLRSRTLGPEHLETQTQLRRKIRAMHTRIHQLEDHIKASKKKLSQAKSGKPSLHAPSIDTINRTYRNIDIAIGQQQNDITRLTARISKLNLSPSSGRSSHQARDPRLPDPVSQSLTRAITPNVAVTTAAALNSERSAQRLKKALLSARKEPLLNSKASSSAGFNLGIEAPVAFNTPARVPAQAQALTFNTPIPMLFKAPANMNLTDFPEDNFNPIGFTTPTRRGAGGAKKHSGPVPLKKSGSPEPNKGSSAPGSPSFDWGPLPTFNSPTRPVDNGFQPISLGKKPTLFS